MKSSSSAFRHHRDEHPALLEPRSLKEKIRKGREPDNPSIIDSYLRLDIGPSTETSAEKRVRHFSQVALLLDTIEDRSLPEHWRETCLNYINKPLAALCLDVCDRDSKLEINQLFARIRKVKVG